jgi:hypothetical protein
VQGGLCWGDRSASTESSGKQRSRCREEGCGKQPSADAPAAAGAVAKEAMPKKGKTMNAEASTFAVALDVAAPANMEQDDGADSVVAGACPAVPQSQPYAGRMCVAALLLTGPAQTTEPIDADDSWLRPELDITRLKTEAPVEIQWGGEWWYLASFLSLVTFGDVFSCVPITG